MPVDFGYEALGRRFVGGDVASVGFEKWRSICWPSPREPSTTATARPCEDSWPQSWRSRLIAVDRLLPGGAGGLAGAGIEQRRYPLAQRKLARAAASPRRTCRAALLALARPVASPLAPMTCMANALEVGEHRHPRVHLDPCDQAGARRGMIMSISPGRQLRRRLASCSASAGSLRRHPPLLEAPPTRRDARFRMDRLAAARSSTALPLRRQARRLRVHVGRSRRRPDQPRRDADAAQFIPPGAIDRSITSPTDCSRGNPSPSEATFRAALVEAQPVRARRRQAIGPPAGVAGVAADRTGLSRRQRPPSACRRLPASG